MLEGDPAPARRPVSRFARARAFTWAYRIALVVLLATIIPLSIKKAHSAIFFENQEFVLRDLTCQSNGALTAETLAQVANVSSGMKLLELDLDKIRTRLEKIPVIEKAIVSREMPDRLTISVQERTPIAWLSCPPLGIRPGNLERGFLVDEDGYLFRCMNLTQEAKELPIIEHFTMPEPREGIQLNDTAMQGALRLIGETSGSHVSDGMKIHLVRVRNEWSLQGRFQSGMQAVFDLHELDRGINDLKLVVDQANEMGQLLSFVDVSMSHNIPATFAGPINSEQLSSLSKHIGSTDYTQKGPSMTDAEKHLHSILNGG